MTLAGVTGTVGLGCQSLLETLLATHCSGDTKLAQAPHAVIPLSQNPNTHLQAVPKHWWREGLRH